MSAHLQLNTLHGRGLSSSGGAGKAQAAKLHVFESPSDLGQLRHGNVFEAPITPAQVAVFVNFLGFALHNPEVRDLVSLFWKQLEWIQPESYVTDEEPFLTFVCRDNTLFTAVREALTDCVPNS